MKTAIICISDPYLKRGELLADCYRQMNDEVVILTPDFSHREKKTITDAPKGTVLLPHRPYRRNMSWQRMAGHREFAITCKEWLEKWKPDRIHCLIPANSLTKEMAEYKKAHPGTWLIFDVMDLWPESLPLSILKKNPATSYWRKLRDKNLSAADLIFVECDLFRNELTKHNSLHFQTLYWTTQQDLMPMHPDLNMDTISLAYLGSINNIIDIDLIGQLIKKLSKYKPVIFHVIGKGEKKDILLETARTAGAQVMDHGQVFDFKKKQEIFDQCHFGLNIMKPQVNVGLSMKSLDYFCAGLPLINTLQGDTASFCENDAAGFNLNRNRLDELALTIASQSLEENLLQRKACQKLYQKEFTSSRFQQVLEDNLRQMEAAGKEKKEASKNEK